MRDTIERTARTYLGRRTPWGPPWWAYAVTLGVANLIRQAVVWRTDPGDAVALAAFVAMVLVVFAGVTGMYALVTRDAPVGRAGHSRSTDTSEQLTLWDVARADDLPRPAACR